MSTSITIGSGTSPDPVIITPTTNTVPTNTTPQPVNIVTPVNNPPAKQPANGSTVIFPINNTANVQTPVANSADSDMPYTGTDSGALARIIIGVIFIALVIYIKIQRMDREIR